MDDGSGKLPQFYFGEISKFSGMYPDPYKVTQAEHLLNYDVAAQRGIASLGKGDQTEVEVVPADGAPATEAVAPPDTWTPELLQALDWKRFGALCAGFYEAKGYHSKPGKVRPDGGLELFLYRKGHSGGAVFGVVHCQNWNWKWIPTNLVEALEADRQEHQAALAVMITSTHYADEAQTFAKNKKIELITGEKLVALLNALPESTRKKLLEEATAGDYMTPTCPICDVKMVAKAGHDKKSAGEIWVCPNYPNCSETFREEG